MNPPLDTNEPPQTNEPPTVTEDVSHPKKKPSRINIVNAAVVIVVAAITAAACIELSSIITQKSQSNTTTLQKKVEKTAVDDTTDTLTGSVAQENDISADSTDTDIDDATNAAANVGDGIDENNF